MSRNNEYMIHDKTYTREHTACTIFSFESSGRVLRELMENADVFNEKASGNQNSY